MFLFVVIIIYLAICILRCVVDPLLFTGRHTILFWLGNFQNVFLHPLCNDPAMSNPPSGSEDIFRRFGQVFDVPQKLGFCRPMPFGHFFFGENAKKFSALCPERKKLTFGGGSRVPPPPQLEDFF